jgi:hypothetical protein
MADSGVVMGKGKLAGRFCVRVKDGTRVKFQGCFKSEAAARARLAAAGKKHETPKK